jgi:hypothetical protein
VVLEKKILKVLVFSLYKHMQKQFPLLWPLPIPGGHDFNKLPLLLFHKAFMQILAFLAQWFLRFLK